MAVNINKLNDDSRGYYISLDSVFYLHNDGTLTHGIGNQKTAFWDDKNDAVQFFKQWRFERSNVAEVAKDREIERLKNKLKLAVSYLQDASVEVENWGAYASEYFQEKWQLKERADLIKSQSCEMMEFEGDLELINDIEICPNCETAMPDGCQGCFSDQKECYLADGTACSS